MAKKKSCLKIRNPRVLSTAERDLYSWVDAEVFTQSSRITSDVLLELHREMRLTEDVTSERDYMLEAADPSDRLPFQAAEDRIYFLGDDFLMPLRILFRNSSGITSRFFLFLVVVLFGLMMRGSPFPGCTRTWRRGNIVLLLWIL
ncbi:hypothetical protein PIB30_044582 [Stylosanthes scabra]|uniref:Uncharacterized protein n=1 Tax=Stylosanthes scabra TaxID=79078 RepID=A0ABU6YDA1_9FABA|nr:hypothetical protein [Stylosanthes scabra]